MHIDNGGISFTVKHGRVLDLCFGGKQVIKEIYFALRDLNWKTIPYSIQNIEVIENEIEKKIEFEAEHKQGEINFVWKGYIRILKTNQIYFSFNGQALSEFEKNRIGFCVLYPSEFAGKKCMVEHTCGPVEESIFPEFIAPFQPFKDIKKITCITDRRDREVEVTFEGDIFEMEDQRNWTDNSFKVYCTPLEKEFPVKVKKGQAFYQSISVLCRGDIEGSTAREESEIIRPEQDMYVLENMISQGVIFRERLSGRQEQLFADLNLGHFRYELHFPADMKQWENAVIQIERMNAKVLLTAFFTADWKSEAELVKKCVMKNRDLYCGIVVHEENKNVISKEILKEIKALLKGCDVPVGSGTDAFFTQLNRERIPKEFLDFVVYSNNPQVHAFDDASILDTVEGQRSNIKSCRKLYPDTPVWITPITLKMRWNPDAVKRSGTCGRQDQIDSRQCGKFTAVWYLKVMAMMLEEKAEGVTWFENVGELGIMGRGDIKRDDKFPDSEANVYPIYHVMKFLKKRKNTKYCVQIAEDLVCIWMQNEKGEIGMIGNLEPRKKR